MGLPGTMTAHQIKLLLAFLGAFTGSLAVHAESASPQPRCVPVIAGLDTTHSNFRGGPFLGQAYGQTFFAPDTLISSLTVWRSAGNQSVIGAKLYITDVDTTRTPPYPNVHSIVLDGPVVHVYDSDPPGQLIPMRFSFDPPFALPRAGTYAFFLQAENCWQGVPWTVVFDTTDDYPYGLLWTTNRATNSCFLAQVVGENDTADLVFEIQFCGESVVPTLRRSWGRLKTIYR